MKFSCAALVTLTLAIAASPCLALGNRDDAAAEKLGFKLSLQCWTYNRLTFFETVDKAAGMGIKYLEAFPGQKLKPGSDKKFDQGMSEETIAEVKKKLADAGGLKVVAFGVCGVPTDEAGARKMYDWAKTMGIEVLVTETWPKEIHDKLSTEYKIRYALHNHPASWPPEQVLTACKDRGPLIGSCSDTGHWMRAKRVPVDTIKQLGSRVLHLHFKDLNEFGGGHDVPWGTGKGKPEAVMAELKKEGFKGYFSIEYEHGSLDDLAKDLPLCVEFFDKTAKELAQ
jgi:sugar phosphate isomerase/epimerase